MNYSIFANKNHILMKRLINWINNWLHNDKKEQINIWIYKKVSIHLLLKCKINIEKHWEVYNKKLNNCISLNSHLKISWVGFKMTVRLGYLRWKSNCKVKRRHITRDARICISFNYLRKRKNCFNWIVGNNHCKHL